MNKKTYLVQQDNSLADEKDSFKRYERNVLYQAVRALQEKYPVQKLEDGTTLHAYDTNNIQSESITLSEAHLLECLGAKNKGKRNHLPEVKAALQTLAEKRCDIPESIIGKNWVYVNWISSAEYNPDTKTFEIEFSKKIIPYLLNLSGKFTQFDIYSLFEIKNPYAQRFYIKCKKEKGCSKNDSFIMTEDEIRETFQVYSEKDGKKVPMYPNHSQFRNNVIEKARKELKAKYDEGICDCYFEYTPIEFLRGESCPCKWSFTIGYEGHPADAANQQNKELKQDKRPIQLSFFENADEDSTPDKNIPHSHIEEAKQSDLNLGMIDLTLKRWFANDPNFRGEIIKALSHMSELKVAETREKIFRIITNKDYQKSGSDGTVRVLRSALTKDVLKKGK